MTTTLHSPDAPVAHDRPAGRARSGAAGRLRGLVRGSVADPAWVRPSLLALLGVTALLYLWNLGASGWANSFYSAAVQAGSTSWKAFFFGSFDAASFITVDKPPASLWVMDISARIFGVNSWSLLVPQALEGVAAVGLLYATVRRWFSPGAALMAGAVMALTPVAALMFRFNNPDALLVLLLVAAAYATTRALEKGSVWWLVLSASLVGTGFLTKMLQAFLVLPALAGVYLLAAPVPLRRRLLHLLAATGALLVASGWWVAIVQLIPASSRPYIGGSQDNSLLNLIFGYNGFGRISGNETGSVIGGGPGAAAGASPWGPTGWDRLFLGNFGGQVSWLLPASLLLLGVGLWVTRRAPRTNRARAALVMWGGWLVVTALVFSYAAGIIHPYYTVALAPAIGAVVGIVVAMLWRRRAELWARGVLEVALVGTAGWAYALLDRSPDWMPWLRVGVVVGGVGAALVLLGLPRVGRGSVVVVMGAVALLAAGAGPAAYTVDTVVNAHAGAIPSAGPAVVGGGLGGARAFGGGGVPGSAGGFPGFPGGNGGPRGGFGFGGGPGGGFPGGGAGGVVGGPGGGGGGANGVAGGPGGGLLFGSNPSPRVTAALQQDASRYTWVAATVGANSAAGYQLATNDPILAIGGFNGTDPTPTLQQFQRLVAGGQIHYFIAGGRGGGPGVGASSSSTAIASWVQANFAATTVDGTTLYDLTSGSGS
ncbi:MAG TPA: glycosyltransferase family 39 protein [Candidatus Angelobacter sp.]|jgi:4-amino-4-deoxy-L-arabinose transferase-like glycosyltransferase|nr:glycosyltransferase family 39 protein [Candidatus Angelobacter sp.]